MARLSGTQRALPAEALGSSPCHGISKQTGGKGTRSWYLLWSLKEAGGSQNRKGAELRVGKDVPLSLMGRYKGYWPRGWSRVVAEDLKRRLAPSSLLHSLSGEWSFSFKEEQTAPHSLHPLYQVR